MKVDELQAILEEMDSDMEIVVIDTCECCTRTELLVAEGIKEIKYGLINHNSPAVEIPTVLYIGSKNWAKRLLEEQEGRK